MEAMGARGRKLLVSGGITELVRGRERDLLERVSPRVRREDVVLDLDGVERVDAAGLAVLVELYCEAIKAGHEFTLTRPGRHVREVLGLVGLDRILMTDEAAVSGLHSCAERVAA
jgi:anti-anti-sigma factor